MTSHDESRTTYDVMLVPCRPDNKRRTKHISRSLEPEWHQTLVFPCARREDVSACRLHVSVWDYDRFKRNDFLGEFTVSLEGSTILHVIISNKRHYCAAVLCLLLICIIRQMRISWTTSHAGTGYRPRPVKVRARGQGRWQAESAATSSPL